MLCCVIRGPLHADVEKQIQEAENHVDLLELRVDEFSEVDLTQLTSKLPFLITSKYPVKHPNALYYDTPNGNIASYHNYEVVPKDLDSVYSNMQQEGILLYKIACFAPNALEALRLYDFAKDKPLIAIAMGQEGVFTRLMERKITYAALTPELINAPGQLTVDEFVNTYLYHSHTSNSSVYGLIGDPVTLSISHITHNAYFKRNALNSLYVKIPVKKEDIALFLNLAKKHFSGLSVTMPLKEIILPYVDVISDEAKAIGAINTLKFIEGKIHGINTDGIGALNALERQVYVDGKEIAIIGKGGSAKAIAHEAKKRGAYVTIYDRSSKHSLKPYEILINATPDEMPILEEQIIAGTCLMDIKTKPKETRLLKAGKEKECKIVYGFEMFVDQALEQFNFWFGKKEEGEALFLHASNLLIER